METVPIGEKTVGEGRPTYVIAEAGVNHNGELELAKKLIDAAKTAGADAVKFQTFTPDEFVTRRAAQAQYQAENTNTEESQISMLKKLALSQDAFRELKGYAAQRAIEFLSTPFSIPDADFLDSIGVCAFKVSSGDLTNLPLLAHLARTGKSVIFSTGMADMREIREAYDEVHKAGARNIIMLQCTSEYPTPRSHANLRVLETLQSTFNVPVGFSDHTEGIEVGVFAVSLGAKVIEKHLTLDRGLPGPDHRASLLPHELKDMIEHIRAITPGSLHVPEEILGSGEKKPTPEESATAKLVRKSIAARTDIAAGEILTSENVFIARPEGEVLPKSWSAVLGKKAAGRIPLGTSLTWAMIA